MAAIKPTDLAVDRGDRPFRWWLIDGTVPAVTDAVPPPEWFGWEARYGGDLESGKRTCRAGMPDAFADAVEELVSPEWTNFWCDQLGYAVIPDPLMWGGGLQVTDPGGSLAVHLDGDRQRKLPHWRRALTVVAFAHDSWDDRWGGRLALCDPVGSPVEEFAPVPGRLIAFECSDLSYHGVGKVTGPACRVSLSVAFLSPAGPQNTRVRSLFMPNREKS